MDIIKDLQFQTLDKKLLVVFLLLLACVDVLTGLINAVVKKELQSSKMREGIIRKVYEFIYTGIGALVDMIFHLNIMCYVICIFYIMQEMLSILENIGKSGVPVPAIIKKFIIVLNGTIEKYNKLDKGDEDNV